MIKFLNRFTDCLKQRRIFVCWFLLISFFIFFLLSLTHVEIFLCVLSLSFFLILFDSLISILRCLLPSPIVLSSVTLYIYLHYTLPSTRVACDWPLWNIYCSINKILMYVSCCHYCQRITLHYEVTAVILVLSLIHI